MISKPGVDLVEILGEFGKAGVEQALVLGEGGGDDLGKGFGLIVGVGLQLFGLRCEAFREFVVETLILRT